MATSEKTVTVGGVSEDAAHNSVMSQTDVWDGGALHKAVPDFKKIDFRSFKAEWALVGEDIQVKFFLPKHAVMNTPEARQSWMTYWLERFVSKLDETAQEYFKAKSPRLVVKWTEEFQSWWFRASSYGHLLDVGAFLLPFFESLDEVLQEKKVEN